MKKLMGFRAVVTEKSSNKIWGNLYKSSRLMFGFRLNLTKYKLSMVLATGQDVTCISESKQ